MADLTGISVELIPELEAEEPPDLDHDGSTNALIRRYRRRRERRSS